MKITPKNIAKVLLAIILIALKIVMLNILNFIPLFFLKWPIYINVILIILFACSSMRLEDYKKIDRILKNISFVNILLNIAVWVIALISFINGTININAIVFYILFGINAFLTLTKIPSLFKKDAEETQNNQ